MFNYRQKLADAARYVFSLPVTGYLLDVRSKEVGVRGAIFQDALKRYQDGDTFTTSKITDVRQEHGYTVYVTITGACYIAVSHLMFIEDSIGGVSQTLILRAS
jgi:hypothetical protein